MKKYFVLAFVLICILMLVQIEFVLSRAGVPGEVFIRVLKSDGVTPEVNAKCSADIITSDFRVEDKPLEKVDNLFDLIDKKFWDRAGSRGYYLLETGLGNYEGDFEIRIVCVSPNNSGVSYTILNNTNIPCEVKDGDFLIC